MRESFHSGKRLCAVPIRRAGGSGCPGWRGARTTASPAAGSTAHHHASMSAQARVRVQQLVQNNGAGCVRGRRPRCGVWPCRNCCARIRRRHTRARTSTPRWPRPGRGASAGRACAAASSCRCPSARPATRRCGCGRGILAGSAACCCAQARGSRCGWAGWPAPTARAGGARAGARACAPCSAGASGRTVGCRRRSASPISCWRAVGCGVCRPRSSPAGSRPGCSATRCCRRCAQAAVSVKPPRSKERA